MRERKTIYRWKFAVRMLFFLAQFDQGNKINIVRRGGEWIFGYAQAGTFVHPKIDNGRFLRCRVGNKYVAGSVSFRASGGHPIPFTE